LKPASRCIPGADEPLTFLTTEIDPTDHATGSDGDVRVGIPITGDSPSKERDAARVKRHGPAIAANLNHGIRRDGVKSAEFKQEFPAASADAGQAHVAQRTIFQQERSNLRVECDRRSLLPGELLVNKQPMQGGLRRTWLDKAEEQRRNLGWEKHDGRWLERDGGPLQHAIAVLSPSLELRRRDAPDRLHGTEAWA